MFIAIIGASDESATPVALLIGFGVLVALVGYLAGSRRTVGVGIAILFVATALLLVGGYIAYRDDMGRPALLRRPRRLASAVMWSR